MLLSNNTSLDRDYNSGGENPKDFEIDPMLSDRDIEAFGVMSPEAFDLINDNRAKVIALLYVYPKKLDIDSVQHIQPKIEKLKEAGLTVSEILNVCASNIKVISSREDKYWRKVELLIESDMPPNLLYDMLLLNDTNLLNDTIRPNPSKKELRQAIKGMVSI